MGAFLASAPQEDCQVEGSLLLLSGIVCNCGKLLWFVLLAFLGVGPSGYSLHSSLLNSLPRVGCAGVHDALLSVQVLVRKV